MSPESQGIFPVDPFVAPTIYTGEVLSFPREVIGGAIATIADIGTTLWNSLAPEPLEISTEKVLRNISQDAYNVYFENPDTIHTLSLVGGIFLPVGLTLKMMNALRTGSKAVNWFTQAGRDRQLEIVADIFDTIGEDSLEYKHAKRKLFGQTLANTAVDTLATEASILVALSEHEFMQDYYKDFTSNFLLSTALGTGIGGVIGKVIDNFEIMKKVAPIEQELMQAIAVKRLPTEDVMFGGERLITRQKSIENIQHVLARNADPDDMFAISDFTKRGLEYALEREKALLTADFHAMWKGDAKDLSAEMQQHLMQTFQNVSFLQAETARFVPSSKVNTSTLIHDTPPASISSPEWLNRKGEVTDVVYLPTKKGFVSMSEAQRYFTIADLALSQKALMGMAKKHASTAGTLPRDDGFILPMKSGADADLDLVLQYFAMQKKKPADFSNMAVAPDDVATLKAIYAEARKRELPLKITLTQEKPTWQEAGLIITKRAGLAPSYLKDLAATENELMKHILYNGQEGKILFDYLYEPHGRRIADTLKQWVQGYVRELRTIVKYTEEFSRDYAREEYEILESMRNLRQRKAALDVLRPLADSDGYLWLFRGLTSEQVRSPAPVESYAVTGSKAAQFGNVSLYKVHIDDILAVIADFGSKAEIEILVTRPIREHVPVANKDFFTVPTKLAEAEEPGLKTGAQSTLPTIKTLEELKTAVVDATNTQVKYLAGANHGIEEIAAKTGTPEDTVRAILSSTANYDMEYLKYATDDHVKNALQEQNRALLLRTDKHKMYAADFRVSLQNNTRKSLSAYIVEGYMEAYAFRRQLIWKTLKDAFLSPEMNVMRTAIEKNLGSFTRTGLRNTFFRSANSVVENFGEAGAFLAEVGKKVLFVKNKIKEEIEQPVAELMADIAKDPARLVQANNIINAYASIDGAVRWHKGTLYVPKEREKTAEFLEAETEAAFLEVAKEYQYRGEAVTTDDPRIAALMDQFSEYGRLLYEFQNLYRMATGAPPLKDRGLWIPAFSTRDKQFAYVVNTETKETSILYANSVEELTSSIKGFMDALTPEQRAIHMIIPKERQHDVNLILGRSDPLEATLANVAMRHAGSSQYTLIPANTTMFTDILAGYAHHVDRGVENYVELLFSNVMEQFKFISDYSQYKYSAASLSQVTALKTKPVDAGRVLRNVMLGQSNITEHKAWADWQQRTQVVTDLIFEKIRDIFSPLLKKEPVTEREWNLLHKNWVQQGIKFPYENVEKSYAYDKFLEDQKTHHGSLTQRVITLGNSLITTMLLKFMELGQPLVNALSLPILTSGAMARIMGKEFAGAKLTPEASFSTLATMYDGIRFMNSPDGKKFLEYGEQQGLFRGIVSEATELLSHVKSLQPGALTTAEKALESKFIQLLSRPAEWSEELVRKVSFMTGIQLARKAYPGISDRGATIFASQFMDEAVGNYNAPQRPAFFHGTFGTAIGLFQTYMLTLAQQIYRAVERKNWAALGKQMFLQQSIFGFSSLPGFSQISELIALHFSDNNVDLETGTYRALPEPLANVVLYGLPASLGLGTTTRGDIQPRLPNPFTGLDSLALVNVAQQAYASANRFVEAIFIGDKHMGQALLEAASLQSLSRPIARVAELLNGYSITKSGDIVASEEDMYTMQSALARVFALRPIEEVKLRRMLHLNTIYGAADRDKREEVLYELKSRVREGSLTNDAYESLLQEYLRTGTPMGWRAAVNKAIVQSTQDGKQAILDKMNQEPLAWMVEDLSF